MLKIDNRIIAKGLGVYALVAVLMPIVIALAASLGPRAAYIQP